MASLSDVSDTIWDVTISGTGLRQSLIALALSRSNKKILHVDHNPYYGGPEASFSLQEAGAWVDQLASRTEPSIFSSASITQPGSEPAPGDADAATATNGLSSPSRAYSLALCPQIIYCRSDLVAKLVSSRAYRHIEFLAVGSFFILKSAPSPTSLSLSGPYLVRIPSTREDIFSAAIPTRAKRHLMKLLKLVMSYDNHSTTGVSIADISGSPMTPSWEAYAEKPLTDFMQTEFNLDAEAQAYILMLTLSLDGQINTRDGLATLHKHLSSMGMFGLGFAAIYPKWGSASEIAQVACRACAVGGGVYILGTGIKEVKRPAETEDAQGILNLVLTNDGTTVKTRLLIQQDDVGVQNNSPKISRLVAVVSSPLSFLFEATLEGAPMPAVAVIALPTHSTAPTDQLAAPDSPVYIMAHSSDTGECPVGEAILYLTTLSSPVSKSVLQDALSLVLAAVGEDPAPRCLYQLYYEQAWPSSTELQSDGALLKIPAPSPSLALDDSALTIVRQAWGACMASVEPEARGEFMVFEDRETMGDDVFD